MPVVECDLPSCLLQACLVCAAVSAAVLHASYLGPAETWALTPRTAAEGQSYKYSDHGGHYGLTAREQIALSKHKQQEI